MSIQEYLSTCTTPWIDSKFRKMGAHSSKPPPIGAKDAFIDQNNIQNDDGLIDEAEEQEEEEAESSL